MSNRKTKMTLGIILSIMGVFSLIAGIYLIKEAQKAVLATTVNDTEINIRTIDASTADSDETKRIKGYDFEKFMVPKFSEKYFTLLEWAGDKRVEGRYAETTMQPDLKFRFTHKDVSQEFSVECKYRSNFFKNGIEWGSEKQMANYKKFEHEKAIPVFVAIGVGGTASAPAELYIVPLKEINTPFLERTFLNRYKKSYAGGTLFFDPKAITLH